MINRGGSILLAAIALQVYAGEVPRISKAENARERKIDTRPYYRKFERKRRKERP